MYEMHDSLTITNATQIVQKKKDDPQNITKNRIFVTNLGRLVEPSVSRRSLAERRWKSRRAKADALGCVIPGRCPLTL